MLARAPHGIKSSDMILLKIKKHLPLVSGGPNLTLSSKLGQSLINGGSSFIRSENWLTGILLGKCVPQGLFVFMELSSQ